MQGVENVSNNCYVARRGAHLAAERSPSAARADGARRSVAVPNGEGVASGSATRVLNETCNKKTKKKNSSFKKIAKKNTQSIYVAPPAATPSRFGSSSFLGGQTRSVQRNITFKTSKNLKICWSLAKAPSHEKHFAPLDVRGLWHARPLPTTSALDKSRPAAAHRKSISSLHFTNSPLTSTCARTK